MGVLIKLEERKEKKKERLGQEEEEKEKWETRRRSRKICVDSPFEVRVLYTFKFGFCFDLRNLMPKLSIFKFWVSC